MDSKNDVEEDDTDETANDTDETSRVTLIMFNHLNVFRGKIFV